MAIMIPIVLVQPAPMFCAALTLETTQDVCDGSRNVRPICDDGRHLLVTTAALLELLAGLESSEVGLNDGRSVGGQFLFLAHQIAADACLNFGSTNIFGQFAIVATHTFGASLVASMNARRYDRSFRRTGAAGRCRTVLHLLSHPIPTEVGLDFDGRIVLGYR